MSDVESTPVRDPDGEGGADVPSHDFSDLPDLPHDGEASGSDGAALSEPATDSPSIWQTAAEHFARWRDGDTRAMDELVRLLTPVLWHVVRAYGLETMAAEDVVQTTWLTLVRRHESINEPRAVAGWLTTTARREAWRAGKASQNARPAEAVDLEPLLPPEDSAETVAHLNDRDARLWGAVVALDERCRRLLRIVAFEERPDYARIADDLAMPVGSIGPTRQRCLGKLRTALEADGWKGDTRGL